MTKPIAPNPALTLSPEIEAVISRVVRRARLRRGERRDVEAELRSHFGEGIAEGKSVEALVGEFGDARATAKMIGRAKRRCRGIVWHAWVWSCRGVMALFALVVVTYAWAAWSYYRPAQVSSVPYEERICEAMGMTEARKSDAWRAYRKFRESIPEDWDARLRELPDWNMEWSSDDWLAAIDLASQVRPLIEAVIPTVQTESLGYTAEDWRAEPKIDVMYRGRMILTDPFPMLTDAHALRTWLGFDFQMAKQEGDVARVERLIPVLVNLSRIYDPISIQICQLYKGGPAHRVTSWVLAETSSHGVARMRDIDAINTSLDRFREVVETYRTDAELISMEDFLSHMYGGGAKGGRISAAGWSVTLGDPGMIGYADPPPWWWPTRLMDTPLAPILSRAMPTFDESVSRVREVFSRADRFVHTPHWESFPEDLDDADVSRGKPWKTYRVYPYAEILPAFSHARRSRAALLLEIDAARTAIAIERYRQDQGEYPLNLESLVPQYLQRMPIDPFTGEPLAYRVTAEGPVLYSLGVDRDDDDGAPFVDDKGKTQIPWFQDPGQWAKRGPEYTGRESGDWILWPVCPCPENPAQFPPRGD